MNFFFTELKSQPTEMEKKIIAKMLDYSDLTCSICFDIFEKVSNNIILITIRYFC